MLVHDQKLWASASLYIGYVLSNPICHLKTAFIVVCMHSTVLLDIENVV